MLQVTRVSLDDHGIAYSGGKFALRPTAGLTTSHHCSTTAQHDHLIHIISRYQGTRCNIPIHVTFTCTCNVYEMDSRGNSAGPQQIGGAAAPSQSRPVPAAAASSATANSSSADAALVSPVAELSLIHI